MDRTLLIGDDTERRVALPSDKPTIEAAIREASAPMAGWIRRRSAPTVVTLTLAAAIGASRAKGSVPLTSAAVESGERLVTRFDGRVARSIPWNRISSLSVIGGMQAHTAVANVTSDEADLTATQRRAPLELARHSASTTQSSAGARLLSWVTSPISTAPRATLLIRLMAGAVFLSEGILKFVYTNQGIGRFTKLGFPFPDAVATAVAGFEIIGGVLLLAGLYTRLVALGFSFEMVVAILTTKISLYLGTSPLPAPAAPPKEGMWAVLHESRSDWAQLVCCLFLVLVGAGAMSIDARWRHTQVARA
jgi:putative oxidoreductase